MPIDRDFDVFALYVDPEEARLDADRYEIGGNRAAKDLNNAAIRQSTSTGRSIHPDQIESRTALRVPVGREAVVRHLLQRVPGSATGGAGPSSTTSAHRAAAGRGRDRHRLQVDGQRPLPARRLGAPSAPRPRARSSSTCRSSRSSTAAGTGTTSSPVTRTPSSSRPSGPPRCPTTGPQHGTTDIAITTMNRPDFCAKLLAQIGDDEVLRPYLDTVLVMEQGTQKVVDSEFFPAAEKALGDKLRVHRAGQPRRLRRLRPRPARVGAQGHRDLRDDDGRRRRLRARGHHPGGHLRRPGPAADHRRRPHVQPLLALDAAQLRRDRPAVAVLVEDAARRLLPTGTSRPATSAPRGGCTSASTSTSTAGSCA